MLGPTMRRVPADVTIVKQNTNGQDRNERPLCWRGQSEKTCLMVSWYLRSNSKNNQTVANTLKMMSAALYVRVVSVEHPRPHNPPTNPSMNHRTRPHAARWQKHARIRSQALVGIPDACDLLTHKCIPSLSNACYLAVASARSSALFACDERAASRPCGHDNKRNHWFRVFSAGNRIPALRSTGTFSVPRKPAPPVHQSRQEPFGLLSRVLASEDVRNPVDRAAFLSDCPTTSIMSRPQEAPSRMADVWQPPASGSSICIPAAGRNALEYLQRLP